MGLGKRILFMSAVSLAAAWSGQIQLIQAAEAEEVAQMLEEAPEESVVTGDNEYGELETENTGDYYNEAEDPLDLQNQGHLVEDPAVSSETRIVQGELHNHTNQSSDASEPYMTFENVLDAAFGEELSDLPTGGQPQLDHSQAFDYYMTADHLRGSDRDVNGDDVAQKPTWQSLAQQVEQYNKLKSQGKYAGKIYYPGFEWDMFGLDHATVAIIEDGTNRVPLEAYRHFEWLYAYDTPTETFRYNESNVFGPRDNVKADKSNSYDGLRWLQKHYPESILLVNHPSRHNEGSGEVKAADIRDIQDLAPNVVVGLEGMPGNQMGGDRGETTDIYGGADVMVAKVGGVWDAMLGEGRPFYNFANSDFHFKVSSNELYSSGYWPSEYSRNYTKVTGNTFQDVARGLKSGNTWSVYGDLIKDLEFFVTVGDQRVEMGQTLAVPMNTPAHLSVRFRATEKNNYQPIFPGYESSITNQPLLDHMDLILGNIYGQVSDRNNDYNPTTRIGQRFTSADWGEADEEGYYHIDLPFTVDQDFYLRLRGTNHAVNTAGETDALGNPLLDPYMEKPQEDAFDNEEAYLNALRTYFNQVNERNYSDLWFYSNPISLLVADDQVTLPSAFADQVAEIVGHNHFNLSGGLGLASLQSDDEDVQENEQTEDVKDESDQTDLDSEAGHKDDRPVTGRNDQNLSQDGQKTTDNKTDQVVDQKDKLSKETDYKEINQNSVKTEKIAIASALPATGIQEANLGLIALSLLAGAAFILSSPKKKV